MIERVKNCPDCLSEIPDAAAVCRFCGERVEGKRCLEEIPWHKVAGFDYLSGIFWDRVRIKTRGQSSTELPCLAKSDGKRIREVLQQLEQ